MSSNKKLSSRGRFIYNNTIDRVFKVNKNIMVAKINETLLSNKIVLDQKV